VTYVYPFDHPHALPLPELTKLIGSKAANLSTMVTALKLPVPPGFTIATSACTEFLAGGWPDGLEEEIRAQMARVERAVARRFGSADDPLLVSVRSGAPVSMPGMMDTILNLGLNRVTEAGLGRAADDEAFAASCTARFTAMYRAVVGAEEVPDDPWAQLRAAIAAVFRSWDSDRAKSYRRHEGIPDDLGTAVTVQAMVFGNLGPDSGTGVLFTRNPATGEPTIYGDVMFDAQGEDVVAGDHHTEPLSVLDDRMPDVAGQLRGHADALERHFADLCDIEFTIERGRLWMLQVRVGKRSPLAALRIAVDLAEDPDIPVTRAEAVQRVLPLLADPPRMQAVERPAGVEALAAGLGASPGVACGEIVVSADEAVAAAAAGRNVILVRAETSPDDVHGMAKSAGVLTASGGLASHAAVVARGWGIPAVVGADAVTITAGVVRIGRRTLPVGETITIDGSSGEVFAGEVAGKQEVVTEAATLRAWARELGFEIPVEGAGAAAPAGSEPLVREDVLRTLLIKGYATPDALAACMFCTPEQAAGTLDRLVADGLVEISAAAFRLSADGRAAASELVAADREHWGVDEATGALDAFLALDGRMKETVTAWQMRDVDGSQTFNDHSDAGYDRAVLDQLAGLHADAVEWLRPLAARLHRLEGYEVRLQRAVDRARDEDTAYVASPRVDSYHSVWFELHEDLIRLAGRTRADEAAAGRA
jgi:pyruvate,orthophosphate dikinase